MLSSKTIEILKKLAKDLDPPERIELYINLYERYLKEAEDFYKKGISCKLGRSSGVL